MSTYKVPQDVEAEDKLVAFLSLRQFIFVILGIGFGYLTFFFFTKVHPVTALIWVPPTIVFLVLGLYQRKDQPVEVYLASALRYYLKPHARRWDQEGYEERVIVTAPPKLEKHYTKNFSREEATSRLGNLGQLMDSRGWTSKLITDWQNPQLATAAAGDRLIQHGEIRGNEDVQGFTQPIDMMDDASSLVAQTFQSKLTQSDNSTRRQAITTLQQTRQSAQQDAAQARQSAQSPRRAESKARQSGRSHQQDQPTQAQSSSGGSEEPIPTFNKYPSMRQKMVSPIDNDHEETHLSTEQITDLAGASELNVEATAAAAKHLASHKSDGEVEVRLH